MSTLVGLKDLYYALMLTDLKGTGATYQTPVRIAGAIHATINPNASNETIFADDGPMDTATALGKIDVELETSDLTHEVQSALLGHSIESHGIITRKSTDIPPFVAIGFRALKSSGNYRYMWLLKGKFMVPELQHETKADKIKFQSPKIKGSFLKRDFDEAWMRAADGDSPTFNSQIPANWFTDPNYTPTP